MLSSKTENDERTRFRSTSRSADTSWRCGIEDKGTFFMLMQLQYTTIQCEVLAGSARKSTEKRRRRGRVVGRFPSATTSTCLNIRTTLYNCRVVLRNGFNAASSGGRCLPASRRLSARVSSALWGRTTCSVPRTEWFGALRTS